jgi:hypothetical protein
MMTRVICGAAIIAGFQSDAQTYYLGGSGVGAGLGLRA